MTGNQIEQSWATKAEHNKAQVGKLYTNIGAGPVESRGIFDSTTAQQWAVSTEEVCCDGVQKLEPLNYYKITLSDFQRLLGRIMDALDASIPNKQQHAATTRIVRKSFDATYHDMLRDFGGCGATQGGAYDVEPIR